MEWQQSGFQLHESQLRLLGKGEIIQYDTARTRLEAANT